MSIDTTKDISSVSYNGVNIPLASSDGWQPDADMQWAKSVCENDVQDGFIYKVLQMISNGYVYTDIVVPTGGAVKTSDGGYYTTDTKHIWNDTNARQSAVGDYKVRWLIYYYTSETPTISLLNDVMYACFDGVKFGTIFANKQLLQYFDIINNADLKNDILYLGSMFNGCSSLKTLPLINTINVTNMISAFNNCTSLCLMPFLNTSNVISMSSMFMGCASLPTIPQFNTSNVIYMDNMFTGCSALRITPQFNTINVTNMANMFENCYSLQTLYQLDTGKVTNMQYFVSACSNLQTITLLNLDVLNVSTNLFRSCSYLEFLNLTNIGVNLNISFSTKYSVETLVNVIANLKDLTGLTAQTLTMGTTNKNKLTAEQIAAATAKNWSVA